MVDWAEYELSFRRAAAEAGHGDSYVERCLEYAKRLHSRSLPVVYDGLHFCMLVGYTSSYVYAASNRPEGFYRSFQIPKKAGGFRVIREPLPSLKEIQRWILRNILNRLEVSRYAKGFVRDVSLRDNARFHVRQKVVVNLDLVDFFGSINRSSVYAVFRDAGYATAVAGLMSRLCTLDGALPQGSPTSPALSNLVARSLDRELWDVARAHDARYTRYADDITFSGDLRWSGLIRDTRSVVERYGFSINDKKTSVMRAGQRQVVTGVVVNNGMHRPREVRREMRQALRFVTRYGFDEHCARIGEEPGDYLLYLRGVASSVLQIDPKDVYARHLLAVLRGVG